MTNSRKRTYYRKWFSREVMIDQRNKRKDYNRRIRHTKITEDSTSKEAFSNRNSVFFDTMS